MPVALSATMRAHAGPALQLLERAFNSAHVYITEAHQLGGLALVLHWDMEGDHRLQLESALLDAGARLDIPSRQRLRDAWHGPSEGSLYVALEHEGRDERIPIPAVPG